MIEFIKQLPEGHSGLIKLIKRNYKSINFDKLKAFDLKSDLTEIQNFYRQLIEEILISSPEALELLKNLFVINIDIETNIDRKSVNSSYKLSNIEKAFTELLDTRIIKEKEGKEEIYEFSFPQIQNILEILADETCHERAL